MNEQELRNLYQQFLDHNAQAFVGRQFQVAYHALAAAMHCAQALREHHLLAEVQRRAEQQGRWIDTETPDHHLSSRSAQVRGHTSIFASLVKQAHAIQLGLKVDAEVESAEQMISSRSGQAAY
jgi:hypothetical protein